MLNTVIHFSAAQMLRNWKRCVFFTSWRIIAHTYGGGEEIIIHVHNEWKFTSIVFIPGNKKWNEPDGEGSEEGASEFAKIFTVKITIHSKWFYYANQLAYARGKVALLFVRGNIAMCDKNSPAKPWDKHNIHINCNNICRRCLFSPIHFATIQSMCFSRHHVW